MARPKGYRPDPAGHRKMGFHLLPAFRATSTPDSASVEDCAPPVMDQGETSSCVGHGTSGAVFTSLKKAGTPLTFVPSPRGIYCLARAVDRVDSTQPLTDEGSEPNQAMRAIGEWGVRPIQAPTSDGRYSDCEPANVNAEPTLAELEQDAQDCVVGAYAITVTGPTRIEQMRQAIAAGHAVGIGTFVATDFESWTPDKPAIGAQNESDPNGGGHWFYAVGYRTAPTGKTEVRIRNSWGSATWGDNGDAWVAEELLQQASDLYVFAIKAQVAA